MRFGLPAAVLASVVSVSGAASAVVCQDKSMTSDEIVEAISASPGCERAMKLFRDCSFGASGDVQLGEAVEKKCEGDFAGRLKPPQKQAYQREMGICDRKYRNESGTMKLRDGKIVEYHEVANTAPAFVDLKFAPERIAKIVAKQGAALKVRPEMKRHLAE